MRRPAWLREAEFYEAGVAILIMATMARSIQSGFGLSEHAFPILCGVFIGPCNLLAMWLSSRHAARGAIRGNAE
ncbi:hypothetical protein [Xanthomonas graminis]|uniref:hypothetical protein n=1 Tax=Xanthomonas graminis TaxID=3390026 RepID=UPI001E314F72|nr:hypothetical protein [Xanthomonas translucens]